MSEQPTLDLPLAGTIADVRDRLAAENPKWGNRPTFHCACCGQAYPKGEWRCCGPPGGMTSANWMTMWHDECPNGDPTAAGKGKARCPYHCGCERLVGGNLPLPRRHLHPKELAALVEELRQAASTGKRTSSLPADDISFDPEELEREPPPRLLQESEWPPDA
jgi:hypothetical protein